MGSPLSGHFYFFGDRLTLPGIQQKILREAGKKPLLTRYAGIFQLSGFPPARE